LLKKYSRLALSTFSPSQASSVIPAECAECRELIEYLKPYISSVLEEPSNVESVAKRLLEDEKALSLLTLVFQITLMRFSERDLVATYRELGERFKSVERVLAELWKVLELGYKWVFIVDDNFIVPIKRIIDEIVEMLRRIVSEGLNKLWFLVQLRADFVARNEWLPPHYMRQVGELHF